jgi:hypothetical protein
MDSALSEIVTELCSYLPCKVNTVHEPTVCCLIMYLLRDVLSACVFSL